MVETLAALHSVDIEAVGLGDIGPRADFVARQLRRWQRQWEQTKPGDFAAMDELHRRLEVAMPPQQRDTIVHGDFRLGNLMLDDTGEVLAILDWELAALGDPLADLGWTVMWWDPAVDTGEGPSPAALEGFASTSALDRPLRGDDGAGRDRPAVLRGVQHLAAAVHQGGCGGPVRGRRHGRPGARPRASTRARRSSTDRRSRSAMLDGAHDHRWTR